MAKLKKNKPARIENSFQDLAIALNEFAGRTNGFILQLNKRIMNKLHIILILVLFSTVTMGCEFIGDIFKAGVWVGIIVVIAIIAVIGFLIKLFKG